jgi:hypothetical protein
MKAELSPGKQYQQMLMARVGEEDPALIQARTPDLVRQLVSDAGQELRTKPAPGEFSILELVGHMLDAEMVSATRYRWILAEDKPALPGYEQDEWVRVSTYGDADPAELLEAFSALRKLNLALWQRTPASERQRFGEHSERGPESYEVTFRLIAGHDLIHLDQGRETLAAVRAVEKG